MMENQIVAVTQLLVIVERLRDAKDSVEQRTAQAKSLVCTSETLKVVKEARATLNKEFAAFELQRKAVKTAILSPYEAFEKTYKECVTNAFDPEPVWEDITDYIKNGWNWVFENQTVTSGRYGFNFKLTCTRGASGKGGSVDTISGGFE